MKKELENKLIQAFPELYRVHGYCVIERGLTPVYFAVGDGWFNLLWDLSEKITDHLKATYIPPKMTEMSEGKDDVVLHPLGIAITDIKEKYAGLRYYYNGGDDIVDKFVSEAEELSYKTCEKCGNPGEVIGTGWYTTRCNDCMTPEERIQNEKRKKEDQAREDAERNETD